MTRRQGSWRAGLFALLAGALLPLAFAPFGLWPAALVSVAALWLLLERSSGRGFWLGWSYGVGKYAAGVSWVYVSIHEHGHAPPLLAGALVGLFAVGMGLFPALQCVTYRAWRASDERLRLLWFVLVWVLFEWLLTWVFTGFPWLFLGSSHVGTWLGGWAPVGGVLLVSLAALLGAAGLALLVSGRQRRWRFALTLALAPWLLGGVLSGISWVRPGAPVSVALVQGNVDQTVKWLPDQRIPIVERYLGLSEPHWGVQVMVWPEAAITLLEHQAESLLRDLDARGRAAGTSLVLGIVSMERAPEQPPDFYNTALALGAGDGRYRKRRLVPFGEYVPLERWLRGAIEFFDLPMSHTEPGPWRQPPLTLGPLTAVMAICYEIAYPDLVRQQAGAADLLLTISNDSWFGASHGPWQHLEIARMRALENGRYLLRSTNNGRTALIGPSGELAAELAPNAPGVLRGEARAMHGTTPYTRFGDLPLVVAILFLGLVMVSLRASQKAVTASP